MNDIANELFSSIDKSQKSTAKRKSNQGIIAAYAVAFAVLLLLGVVAIMFASTPRNENLVPVSTQSAKLLGGTFSNVWTGDEKAGFELALEVKNKSSQPMEYLEFYARTIMPGRQVAEFSTEEIYRIPGGINPNEKRVVRPIIRARYLNGSEIAFHKLPVGALVQVLLKNDDWVTIRQVEERKANTLPPNIIPNQGTASPRDPELMELLNRPL